MDLSEIHYKLRNFIYKTIDCNFYAREKCLLRGLIVFLNFSSTELVLLEPYQFHNSRRLNYKIVSCLFP